MVQRDSNKDAEIGNSIESTNFLPQTIMEKKDHPSKPVDQN